MESEKKTILVKLYKLCELARIYGVDSRTLRKRINAIPEVGDRVGHFYSIRQVMIIFRELMLPQNYEVEI